jgi:hypothetical protein
MAWGPIAASLDPMRLVRAALSLGNADELIEKREVVRKYDDLATGSFRHKPLCNAFFALVIL